MQHNLPPRADEPIYWLMFGAGGMAAAMVLPAIVILMIFAGLFGCEVDSGLFCYDQIKGMLGNWFLAIILFGVTASLFWHALHRI